MALGGLAIFNLNNINGTKIKGLTAVILIALGGAFIGRTTAPCNKSPPIQEVDTVYVQQKYSIPSEPEKLTPYEGGDDGGHYQL